MIYLRLAGASVLILATGAFSTFAQSVVSAHSGTVHYFDGAVSVDNVALVAKPGRFNEIKDNGVLRTGQGRAEILLTPGVFLRVGENSEVKLLDNRLMSTRVELVAGSAIVESDDPETSLKDPAVTILFRNFEIQPLKYSVFEISSNPGELKVFKGQASVATGASRTVVKDGHLMPFTGALLSEKFDAHLADDLYLWTRDRSASLSAANMSSARTLASQGGYSAMGFGNSYGGNWYYNSYMGMFTYMPFGMGGLNSFGYGFYSPRSIYDYYNPYGYYWYGSGGSRTGGSTGTPVSTPTALGTQNARLGAVHSTLASPVRSVTFDGTPTASRGGFNNASDVGSSPSFSSASAGASISAPAAVGRASGGGAPAAAGAARGR